MKKRNNWLLIPVILTGMILLGELSGQKNTLLPGFLNPSTTRFLSWGVLELSKRLKN